MKKLMLTDAVFQALDFFIKTAEKYYGSVNGAQTFLPHLETINKNLKEETEETHEEQKS